MAVFHVVDKVSGLKVYEYSYDTPLAMNEFPFSLYDHVAQPDVAVVPVVAPKFGGRRVLTKLEFRGLFPEASLQAIDRFEAQFEQSPFLTDEQKDQVRTSFKNYHEATAVDLDDPRWVPGLGLYVAMGIMSAAEMTEVLNG